MLGSAFDWKLQIDYTQNPVPCPVHNCVMNKRPDIVIYSDSLKVIILIVPKKALLMQGFARNLSMYLETANSGK